MKYFSYFLFVVICSTNLYSQNWINSAGSLYNDEAYDVEVDASGNIYSTGYTTAQSTFGSNISIVTNGYSDIFVSKSSSSGDFLWVKVFGGSLADRGYDLALDGAGNIYVTGYFQGTATFGGFTLTSNGTQDIFIAKLDNTGNVIWAISEGGASGDTGYGVAVDNSGNVIITGQFKGTAQIGSNTFSSAINPNTNLPEFDIFISKYDASGNDLWSLQGSAKYDDRGLALSTDLDDNIYISGQFSDTLTIAGTTHNNTIYNAGMVLKLDPSGNEIWFRRIGAIQTLVYDLETDNQNNLYLTGDFQGQMMIIDGVTTSFLNGNYQYRIFVMKMNEDGEVVWMDEDDSDSEVSSKAICLDANKDIYLTGTFKCVFDEYADTLGSGLFNSVGFNDIFITKYSNSGNREWMRQYGGPYDDYCSGIAISQVDNPIISGGYTDFFNYPNSQTFQNFSGINQNFPPYSWSSNCTPQNAYSYLNSKGNKDIFIGKPVNLNLPHYYYYEHTTCGETIDPCFFLTCADTIEACAEVMINYHTYTAGNGDHDSSITPNSPNHHHGPYFDFLWNSGEIESTLLIEHTSNLGTYNMNSERIDGCKAYQDTIEVILHAPPVLPLLSDDHNINVNQSPYNDIGMCFPDTVSTWFTEMDTSYQFTFTTPQGIFYDSLPHSFYTDGYYEVKVVDTNNCNSIEVFQLSYNYPGSDTIIPFILFEDIDTICLGEVIDYIIGDSITNPTATYTAFCSGSIVMPNTNCLDFSISPTVTGWQYVTRYFSLGYDNLCGLDTTLYSVTDSIYITVLEVPDVDYVLYGIPLLCAGDSVSVWTDSVISGFSWSGNGIISINGTGDSIAVDQENTYYYGGVLTDTITGCSLSYSEVFEVTYKLSPTIESNVPDNIVCPGDSILLSCLETGIAYDWIGPQGNSIGTNQTIWVSIPGFYHCVLIDADSCILTSNSIEIKEFNTPYILPEPGTELCHTGAIDLTAIFVGAPGLLWLPPINSTDPTITVTQPGVYTVEVTQCGFTATDSITITLSIDTAVITPLTDTIICPGDTVLLMANAGMSIYEWSPTTNFNQSLEVTEAGDYVVTITNGLSGCTATSDTVHVIYKTGGVLPTVQDVLTCSGDSVILSNLNQNVITQWFVNDSTSTPFATGDSLIIYNITNDTIIFVENYDTSCVSLRVPVLIQLSQIAAPPIITGDTSVCNLNYINLNAQSGATNVVYNWTGPNGVSSNQNPFNFQTTDTSYSGYYTVEFTDNICTNSDSIYVQVQSLPVVFVLSDTIYKCIIDTITVSVLGDYNTITWSNGATSDTINVIFPGSYVASITDSLGCTGNSDTIVVLNTQLFQPLITDTTLCFGDSLLISSLNNMTVNWYDTIGVQISTGSSYQTPPLFSDEDYFSTFIDSIGCENISNIVIISVLPATTTPIIYGDTGICLGSSLNISTDTYPGSTYQWMHDGTVISIGTDIDLPITSYSDSGVYILTISESACVYIFGEINVSIFDLPQQPSILGDTIYCSGDSLVLFSSGLQNANNSLVWSLPYGGTNTDDTLILSSSIIDDSGLYLLYEVDSNACYSIPDSVEVMVNQTPAIPLVNLEDYCVGDTIIKYSLTNNGSLMFEWSDTNGIISTNDTLIFYNGSTANMGMYFLTVTSNQNCINSGSFYIFVNAFPDIDLGPDTSICVDIPTIIDLDLDPNYSSYLWQDGSTNSYFEVQDSGWYYVTAGNNGCLTTDSIYFAPDSCLIIVTIPNVITPNGDGVNEEFILDFPYNTVSIFNRWDQIVFETSDQLFYWNGMSQNGKPVSDGTYFYIISTEKETYQGFVQVIR